MTIDVETITFGQPAGWLTLNQRFGHWATRHRLTAQWRAAAHWAAVQQLGLSPELRHRPQRAVQVSFPTTRPNQRRDPHNWVPTSKACIDGLVDACVWRDDDARWVIHLDPAFHPAPDRHLEVRVHLIAPDHIGEWYRQGAAR